MSGRVFGRTNQTFPSTWLAPTLSESGKQGFALDRFIETVLNFGTPVEISASPALFGRSGMNDSQTVFLQNSSGDLEHATDARHAADLLQAHLVETLSCLGRAYVDFYFVRSRRAYEESQLAGIMEALESARQEGHIRYFGLRVENFPASIGNWQFHDAFDVVSAPDDLPAEDLETVRRMALSRRAGFLLRTSRRDALIPANASEATLLSVRNVDDLLSVRSA